MRDRPILFSGSMVRAIRSGTKTQTRRLVKPQPEFDGPESLRCAEVALWQEAMRTLKSPYGQPGDRLWVREAWSTHACFDHLPPREIKGSFHYLADGHIQTGKGRPSIHMPRWASRITLDITSVRVERLQDISEADAHDEGTAEWAAETVRDGNKWPNIVRAYQGLWESINGPDSWAANPWVWVVEFQPIESGAQQ